MAVMSPVSFRRSLLGGLTGVGLAALGVAAAQIPSSSVASSTVEINKAIEGRVIKCPEGLKVSDRAVCILASGTAADLLGKVKAKLGSRVLEEGKDGVKTANLLFKTPDGAVAYVLFAQANAKAVLAVVDAPSTTKAAATSTTAPAGTKTPAAAAPLSFAAARDLNTVVTVAVAGNTGTFSRPLQNLVVTAGSASGRLNNKAVTLPGTPYLQNGQLFVPVNMLGSVGCSVTAGAKANSVNVNCGEKSATVTTVAR